MFLGNRKPPLLSLVLVLALLASPLARAYCAVVKGTSSPAAVTAIVAAAAAEMDMPCHGRAHAAQPEQSAPAPLAAHHASHHEGHAGAADHRGHHGQDHQDHHGKTTGSDCAVCLALAAATAAQLVPAPEPRIALRPSQGHAQALNLLANAALHLGGIGSRAPPARA